jgi:hypothetical protein
MTRETWYGAILGAVLGSLVIPGVLKLIELFRHWWTWSRPSRKLLEGLANQDELCKIFVRDFVVTKDTKLYSVEPRLGVGIVPNVHELWPDVEGRAVGNLLNIFGQVGKTKNINIVRMSQDFGEWNANLIVLGAQAQKSFDFYTHMKFVAYQMDDKEIYENESKQVVKREDGYGYGLILKALNPLKTTGNRGVAILIGGFGVLGTAAASYYFKENFKKLGKEFDSNFFGIIVRAPVSAGEQATERLLAYDKRFKS